jgi:peptidoglycan hydrolase-like protein with peptidoglycan-binding domain
MALQSASFKNNQRFQSAANNNPPFRQGERGPAVGLLQVALAALEFEMPRTTRVIVPDGIYGPETAAAVREYQQEEGLRPDGVAGHDTLQSLDEDFMNRPALAQPPFPLVEPPVMPLGDQRNRDRVTPPFRVSVKSKAPAQLAFKISGASVPGGAVRGTGKATIVSGPSPDWVQIGISSTYKVGVNGPDNDLGNNDVARGAGKPPLLMKDVYKIGALMPDSTLENIWRTSFDQVHGTGPTGSKMIDQFMAGTGGKQVHPNGSDLANTARNTKTFVEAQQAVRQEIKKQLKAQLDAGAIDWRKLAITVDIPFSTGTSDLTVPLRFRAMIGGIHGTKLFTRNFRITGDQPSDQVFAASFDLKYEMGDHFGVGKDDMYTPDLIAMNILQHERAGHKPFLNFIEVEDSVTLVIE